MSNFLKICKNFISLIITILAIVALGIGVFAVIDVQFSVRDSRFWAEIIIGLLVQVLMIFLWLPEGKRIGEKNESYVKNKGLVSAEIGEVSRPEMYKPLEDFCEFATRENVEYAISRILGRKNINYDMYKNSEEYRHSIGDKACKWAEKVRVQQQRKVKHIKATEITSCSEIEYKYDIENHEKGNQAIHTIARLILSVATAFIGAIVTVQSTDNVQGALFKFIYWVTCAGATIFFSIRTGVDLVENVRNDYFLRLLDFFNRFSAWYDKGE